MFVCRRARDQTKERHSKGRRRGREHGKRVLPDASTGVCATSSWLHTHIHMHSHMHIDAHALPAYTRVHPRTVTGGRPCTIQRAMVAIGALSFVASHTHARACRFFLTLFVHACWRIQEVVREYACVLDRCAQTAMQCAF